MLKKKLCLYALVILSFINLQADEQPLQASSEAAVAKCKKCRQRKPLPLPQFSLGETEELGIEFLACDKCGKN